MSATLYGGMLMIAARYFGGDVAGERRQYVRNFKRNPDQPKAKPFHTAA